MTANGGFRGEGCWELKYPPFRILNFSFYYKLLRYILTPLTKILLVHGYRIELNVLIVDNRFRQPTTKK